MYKKASKDSATDQNWSSSFDVSKEINDVPANIEQRDEACPLIVAEPETPFRVVWKRSRKQRDSLNAATSSKAGEWVQALVRTNGGRDAGVLCVICQARPNLLPNDIHLVQPSGHHFNETFHP
jgi:hypothetical protein